MSFLEPSDLPTTGSPDSPGEFDREIEISATQEDHAHPATPAQIHATGGPACVRRIVVSVLSFRSDRAVSAAWRGLGPYSSLVRAPSWRLEG